MHLLTSIKIKILGFLKKKGYELIKISEYNKRADYYRQVLVESRKSVKENKIDSIVFSKDRAMQLHAFLESYKEKVLQPGTMHILFKTTSKRHADAYTHLRGMYDSEKFTFIEETDFRHQLLELNESSDAKTIAVFVDDMIFLRDVEYDKILDIDTLTNVVSLGRGQELDYSVVLQKKQTLPHFIEDENGLQYFKWNYTQEHNDWTYPLGVGGYFYGRDEWLLMLRGIQFKAPNSLENALQYYKPFFIERHGVCYKSVACAGVHANIVQTESINPDLGTNSIEELLNKWEEGYKINLQKFYNVNGAAAQLQGYEFIKQQTEFISVYTT